MTRRVDAWSCRGWTSTDCLLLDVEQVEQWCREVVADGDAPTPTLVGIVTRLRACADSLADYLFETSEPSGVNAVRGCGCGSAAPRRARRHADGNAAKQGPGCDSGGRPQGVPSGSKRSVPEAPTATTQGN